MKDYLKLAAIVSIFLLGSASDSYAGPNHNERSLQRYHNMVERDYQTQRRANQQRRDNESRRWRNEQRGQENEWAAVTRLIKEMVSGDTNGR